MLCDIAVLFPSAVCLPNNLFSCTFFRKRPVPSVWATLLEYSTSLSGALAWPCWWLWLSSVTSQGPRRNEWRWQRMHRILTHLPRRIRRILQLIRKVTTYMASKVLKFRGWSWVMPWGTRQGCQLQEVLEKMEVSRLQNFQKQCMLSLTWVLAWEWMSVCDWALVVDKNLLSALHNGFLVCLLSKWWEASSFLKTFLSAKNS